MDISDRSATSEGLTHELSGLQVDDERKGRAGQVSEVGRVVADEKKCTVDSFSVDSLLRSVLGVGSEGNAKRQTALQSHRSVAHGYAQEQLACGRAASCRLPEQQFVALPHENTQHWGRITRALKSTRISSVQALKDALASYNSAAHACSFFPLQLALSGDARLENTFFNDTLPAIIDMALALPRLFPDPLPLLLPDRAPSELALTRRQIASLLANIFLCTMERHVEGGMREGTRVSSIDCLRLFGVSANMSEALEQNCAEKLKCLLHYFAKIHKGRDARGVEWEEVHSAVKGEDRGEVLPRAFCWDDRMVFVRRQSPTSRMDWRGSDVPISSVSVQVHAQGKIEDVAPGVWEADFANAYVGGGVLGGGCVQEEIRFLIAPELIASKVFSARLHDHESMLIFGSCIFSSYSGYGETFCWAGDVSDAFSDEGGAGGGGEVIPSVLTVFDALDIPPRDFARQFARKHILRELDKAASAFAPASHDQVPPNVAQGSSAGAGVGGIALSRNGPVPREPRIATGNWGCGAFGGDVYLKFFIQVLAAVQEGRDLLYFTCGNDHLAQQFTQLVQVLSTSNMTVGLVASRLMELCDSGYLHSRCGGDEQRMGKVLYYSLMQFAAALA